MTRRSTLGAARRSVARALSTTPGKLRLWSLLVVSSVALLWLAGGTAVITMQDTVDSIGHHTVPAIIDARQIHATLADADRAAADAFLSSTVGNASPQRQYEADIGAAGRDLEQAAEHNTAGGQASQALETLIAMLTEYRGLVETARADNRLGYPLGAAYLRRASALMHDPRVGILARVDSLDALNSRDLSDEDSFLWLTAAALVGFALLAIVAFGLLVSMQVFIRRRFRRRRNKRLLGATALLVLLSGWLTVQSLSSYRSLATAEQQAFPRLHALWQARSLAADANGNESLSLIARGNGTAFDDAFKAETSQLADARLPSDAAASAARGQVLFGGILADEVRAASFPGELDSVTAVLSAYQRFLAADAAVRARAAAGDYDGAVALALGAHEGQLGAAFASLDAAFDRAIAVVQRHFDEAIGAAGPAGPVAGGVALLTLSIACLVLWGVQPRIVEYRA
jgi:hypothetical protein